MPRPGKSTADGQHWVYRLEGRRKCWFMAAEGSATVPVRHRAAKDRVVARSDKETSGRKQEALVDAHAELLRAAPATSQPIPLASKLKMADAASAVAIGPAAFVPLPPVANSHATDQLTPDDPTRRQVDVEMLLAAAPTASDVVAVSVPPTTSPFGLSYCRSGR
ncbi:hypothetical protein ACVWYH_000895 [Bradyrhizobium sp. GM24.11]